MVIEEIIAEIMTRVVLAVYAPIAMFIVFSLLCSIVLIVFILLSMFVMSKYDNEGGEGKI